MGRSESFVVYVNLYISLQYSFSCAYLLQIICVFAFQDKHCLLNLTPDDIEKLIVYQMCPIVILLKTFNDVAVKYVTYFAETVVNLLGIYQLNMFINFHFSCIIYSFHAFVHSFFYMPLVFLLPALCPLQGHS